jgi:ATP-dependent Clp protease ATP-binding subunit ClpB
LDAKWRVQQSRGDRAENLAVDSAQELQPMHCAKSSITKHNNSRGNTQTKGAEDEEASGIILSEVVTPQDVAEIVSRWTGIPVTRPSKVDKARVLSLETRMKEHVVGQDAAIKKVAECILRSKAGLSRPNQPTGSFLFLGPTGVGKTETAKALFTQLFHEDVRHMVRLDMSEY